MEWGGQHGKRQDCIVRALFSAEISSKGHWEPSGFEAKSSNQIDPIYLLNFLKAENSLKRMNIQIILNREGRLSVK